MAKRKPGAKQKDQHLDKKMVRMADDIYLRLAKMAEANERPLTRELRLAVIRHLEAGGF